MTHWPDAGYMLLRRHVEQLGYRGPRSQRPCASVLRRFQRFVMTRGSPLLSVGLATAWLRAEVAVSPHSMVIRRAQIVARFLDWLVANGHVPTNPFADLRRACRPHGTRSIVSALWGDHPEENLAAFRPLPHYGSRLGPAIRGHVERMRTLGYKYEHGPFLRFDRFIQRQSGAESLPELIRAYAAESSSPAVQYERLKVGRILVRALQRDDPSLPGPAPRDRLVTRAMIRQRRLPRIFSHEEMGRLLHAARTFPSIMNPLRPETLYTMLVLAYCAGLRVGELIRLQLRDIHSDEGSVDIRETKFFKSRRLPLRPSVVAVVDQYLAARKRAGLPHHPDAPLFGHAKRGYARSTAAMLLCSVIRSAGLKPEGGRRGPRVHDLRHSFVVHRMLDWYRHGINPQSRLPYLATYLGHRDIHSTLVYLTITRELLELANERFRTYGAPALTANKGESYARDLVSAESAPPVLP